MGQTLEIAERWWTAFLAGKLDDAEALYADDVTFRGPGVELNSRAAMRPYLEGFANQFTGMKKQVRSIVEQGERVFIEVELELTHTASQKTVKIYAADAVRVVNGKIVSWAAYWDRAGFGGQLQ